MNGLLSLLASAPEVTSEPLWESRLGRIIGTNGEGRPVVDFEGNPVGPRVALNAVRLDAEGLQATVETRQPVEFRFEDGRQAASSWEKTQRTSSLSRAP